MARGEIFGFLGPSGAGKSTTQNVLIRLLDGYEGSIVVLGRDLRAWDENYYRRIGVAFEAPNHYLKPAFVVVVIGALLLNVPEAARADRAAWVPALLAINLQITTFLFVAGLILLERDEGTLTALAVSPLSPGIYLAARTITQTTLAAAETIAIVVIVFGADGSWHLIMSGTVALGVTYTGFGAAIGTRYESVNALLLPASVFVAALLLPLLPHFGLAPRVLFLLHPTEPALTLIRAGYGAATASDVGFGFVGSIFWSSIAYRCGLRSVAGLMRDTPFVTYLLVGSIVGVVAIAMAAALFDRRLLRRA